MGIQFFTNWELWEQLTFVLAAGIVAVFFIGWIKLWWMQRLLKKHTLLDEEKRARQVEMRKSGLPISRKVEIPFGVRAIQSGVEVEGIWISRPVSLMEPRSSRGASSTTLNMDAEPRPDDKGKAVQGSSIRLAASVTEVGSTSKAGPGPSPLGASFEQNIRQDTRGPSSPRSQATYAQPHTLQRPTNDKAWTTRYSHTTTQAEVTTARHHIETYVPTFSPSTANSSPSPRMGPAEDRLSVSSDEGFAISSPRYPAEVRGKLYQSPFEDSESSSSAGPSGVQGQYCSRVRAEFRGGAFENTEIDRTSSPSPQSTSRPSLASTRPIPVRVYTDQRENTATRVVNTGFQVLPAGTFGRLSGDAEYSPGTAR